MDTSLSNHCHLDNGDANPLPVSDLASPDARPLSHATKAVNDSPFKLNSDSSSGKDPSLKSDDKSKSHKHHHHRDEKRDKHHDKHHDKSKGDRPKDKHREHEKNHDKSKDKDRHKDKEKSRDDKSKSDRPKDKHSSSKDDKHRSEKHDALKNVLNSQSSKPKDHHSSPSSQKLKENSHLNSSKESKHKDGLSSPKPKDDARLKEKINNHHSSSSSSHKPKVSNSTSGSSASHSHSSRDKPKESSKSEKSEKSDKERSESKHRNKDGTTSHKDGTSSHKDGSSSHKPKVDGELKKTHKESHRSDKESHKSDKDKEKRKEHDKHKDEKRKEEKKHKEKENREKSKENSSKDKVHEHKSEPKPIKIKEEDERPPTPDIKREPEEHSPINIKLKVEKSWECFDGVKQEPPPSDDDDDVPLRRHSKHSKSHWDHGEKAARAAVLPPKEIKKENKRVIEEDSEDEPLSARISKVKKLKKQAPANRKRKMEDSDDEQVFKKKKKNLQNKKVQQISTPTSSPTKRRTKKEEEEQNVWKWWEEEKLDEGVKWKFLEHKGPVFAPDYEPLPKGVKFYYDGKEYVLSPAAEEVATFYARMLDHDYTTKEVFNNNFFKDWTKVMTKEERGHIADLKKCNFRKMADYFTAKSEERKAMTKEQKADIKRQNEETAKEYGFCKIDGHVEKIGNFKIEPPGLFRGRGDHPKMGMLKHRTMPENVIINCSKDSNIPKPPQGRKWKEVRHDNTVTWLACWTESIQGQTKYVMLNASSKLKGEKDWQKYETARRLKKRVGQIRETYQNDWKSKEMKVRQRAVALYFIDKLALRAGNEKEEGETADTVGCCSLRVEHIKLHESKDKYMVDFDFLGKDSIRYQNTVNVEKRVYKNLQLFMDNKQPEDDLFDRLNTTILNKHLNELMDGLTAKVFRTYNASKTLQEQLNELTNPDDPIAAKLLSYNRANRAVAILCNHQRAVPKTFSKSMENLQNKISAKRDQVDEVEKELRDLKKNKHRTGEAIDKKKKALDRLREQLHRLEVQATDKEENKDIALGTSKLNYLDPRISVAWCKKFDVPIEKVYNKTQRDKFRWAIDMAGPEYEF